MSIEVTTKKKKEYVIGYRFATQVTGRKGAYLALLWEDEGEGVFASFAELNSAFSWLEHKLREKTVDEIISTSYYNGFSIEDAVVVFEQFFPQGSYDWSNQYPLTLAQYIASKVDGDKAIAQVANGWIGNATDYSVKFTELQ